MNYIINPIWFYFLSISDGLRTVAVVAMAIGCCGVIVYFIGSLMKQVNARYGEDDPDYRFGLALLKYGRLSLIGLLVAIVIYIFVPSKDTLIEMQVAKFATYDNAEWTIDAIKNSVDYIVQAIQSIK